MVRRGVDLWSGTSVATFNAQKALMLEAEVGFVRTNVSSNDSLVRAIVAEGIEVIGLLYNKSVLGPPLNLAAWQTYISGRVNALKDVINIWEIWNEPDQPAYGTVTPADYVQLLATAYAACKAADPLCTVLGGVVSNCGEAYGLAYFKQLLDLHMTDYCDAVSYHPYCVTSSPLYPNVTASGKAFWKLELVYDEMVNRGISKRIWITESGWNSSTVTLDIQALYVNQALTLVETWPWCECYTYYCWQDGGDGNFGLIDSSATRKPSFYAFLAGPTEPCPPGTHWDDKEKDCIPDVPPTEPPVINYIDVWNYPDNLYVPQGGIVQPNTTVRMYAGIANAVLPVSVIYGPSGAAFTKVAATYFLEWNYYYVDWLIPSGAPTGAYDVGVESGSVSSVSTGRFVVAEVTPPPLTFPCPYCDLVFNSEAELGAHITAVHQPVPPPSGCFIATACGTGNPSLTVLRLFRDKCLPPSLVWSYYLLSPPLAKLISGHKYVKAVGRRCWEWLACRLKRSLTL